MKRVWPAVLITAAGYLIHQPLHLTTPIHELGHVIASFLTGGGGRVTGWSSCEIFHDSPFVAVAGAWFEAIVLWAIGVLVTLRLRWWWGGWFLGASPRIAMHIYRITDYSDLDLLWPGARPGTMVLYWVFYVGIAFYLTVILALNSSDRKAVLSFRRVQERVQ